MGSLVDRTGHRYGRLEVLRLVGRNRHGSARWECQCECGSVIAVDATNLKAGTKSCGCMKKEYQRAKNTIHGGYRSAEYTSYHCAQQRCRTKHPSIWKYYGARGIEFRFASFTEFLREVGLRPSPMHSLDRIDNNGHYEPGNVRWASRAEQNYNKRHGKLLENYTDLEIYREFQRRKRKAKDDKQCQQISLLFS